MKTFACILIAAVLAACGAAFGQTQESAGAKIINGFQYPDISWSVPEVGKEVRREVLDNGIIIYMMEDHRLPLFRISAMLHCGSAYESFERMVIPGIVGTVMRTGGTVNISADSLNLLLESMGASLETNIDQEEGSASLDVMAKDIELGIGLLADVLRHPAFPEDKISLAKEQIKNYIKRRNDSPESIISREFEHLIYGEHPYGRILEWEQVKNVTRDDLVACHQSYFGPNNLMLGITGDFDRDQIIALVKKYFGDWPKKEISFPDIQAVENTPRPGVYIIRKDINQANIRFGHLGINRDNPDRFAVSIMNFILGGGSFTSRMTTRVRSDEGLAYSVRSTFETGGRDLGMFFAGTQTKSSTAYKALDLMLQEVKRIQQEPVSDDELATAKDSYLNRYVFDFTSANAIVSRLMELEFNDRPRDLLKTYIDSIRRVSAEDILRVAKKYLHPDNISIMVVGNPDNFEKPLDDFGRIITLEVLPPVLD